MYTCDRCGKARQSIMSVSHSHRRTQKTSLPNLHRISVTFKGERTALRLCSKCVRLVRADEKAALDLLNAKPEVLAAKKEVLPNPTST